jgi:hypothetical protein
LNAALRRKWKVSKLFILKGKDEKIESFDDIINNKNIVVPYYEIHDFYKERIFKVSIKTIQNMIKVNLLDLSSFKEAERIYDFDVIVNGEVNVPLHDFFVNKHILGVDY